MTSRKKNGRVRDGRSKRAGGPVWAKIVLVLGVLVTLAGTGGAVAANYYLSALTDSIDTTDKALGPDAGGAGKENVTGKLPTGAIDILMLGVDTRAGWDKEGKLSLSDSIIVLHVSASHDQAYMISIPRDTVAEIPPDSRLGFQGATAKINAAYGFGTQNGHGWEGGARLAAEAVNKLTGISFDGVVVIDFAGFSNVIQVLGGVYMCVERDTWSSHYVKGADGKPHYKSWDGEYRSDAWVYKKGCRELAGWEALDYARQRKGLDKGDYDRQRHQQQLLKSLAKKAASAGTLTNPTALAALVKAAGSSLKMDTNHVGVGDFVFGLKAIAGADVVGLKTNGGTYASTTLNGESAENITPGTTRLFEAAKNDTLGQFAIDNPEYLIPDTGGVVG